MDSLTTTEFVELLETAVFCSPDKYSDCYESDAPKTPPMVRGALWTDLCVPGFVVTCIYSFEHPKYKPSLVEITEDLDAEWQIRQQDFCVIDDEGYKLSDRQICEFIVQHIDTVGSLDLSVLGNDEIEEIDLEVDLDMETIVVERDDDCSIEFKGEVVARTASSCNQGAHDYSGRCGQWKELTLYKTAGGGFVCEQIYKSMWRGDSDFCRGAVCDDEDDVIGYFGGGWLAKRLYEKAGFDESLYADLDEQDEQDDLYEAEDLLARDE